MRSVTRRFRSSPPLAALLGLALPGNARAETLSCTPIVQADIPKVITVQGIYCLTGDINVNLASGSAIDVQTNNVMIDLNSHKIGNLGAGVGTLANGIQAVQRQNVTIVNGTIRGFYRGIFLDDDSPFTASQGHRVEGMRLDQNTFVGMSVRGRGSVARNNLVVSIGGTTTNGADSAAFGIFVAGVANRIIDNDVIGVVGQGTGEGTGIRV